MIPFLVWASAAHALTLDEAFTAAERSDLQLQLAQETAIQQGTLRGKAWSALSPRVSAHAGYVINNQEITLDFAESIPPEFAALFPESEPIIVQKKAFWQGDLTASARLFSGTALPGLKAAYALSDAAKQDVAAARAGSRSRVAESYYGVLTARRGVEVATEGLELARAQLELATAQRDVGVGDERVVLQARLGVSQAERDLRSAQEGRLEAETGFELVTGLPPDDLELPTPFEVPADEEEAVRVAQRERPDILALDDRVRAARLGNAGQAMTWLPVVDAVGSYNYTENTGLATPKNWTWRVVFQATWDIWDGGLRIANQREAASRVRAAELGQALAIDNAEREVRLAYEAHERAGAALTAVEDDRAVAEESLRLAELGYQAGNVTWIEVQGARLQLQATELSILRERMTRDLAAIELLERTGQL
ncbi:MAG: TolC family protein [Myxococcales bacterium]|nr:TolC family protein [Myxococcales bacterium]